MSTRRLTRVAFTAAAGGVLTIAPLSLAEGPSVQTVAAPCYNGVIPWNPYVRSCTLPGPQHKIRGSAPDANAIIACRNRPGCLAWYINGP